MQYLLNTSTDACKKCIQVSKLSCPVFCISLSLSLPVTVCLSLYVCVFLPLVLESFSLSGCMLLSISAILFFPLCSVCKPLTYVLFLSFHDLTFPSLHPFGAFYSPTPIGPNLMVCCEPSPLCLHIFLHPGWLTRAATLTLPVSASTGSCSVRVAPATPQSASASRSPAVTGTVQRTPSFSAMFSAVIFLRRYVYTGNECDAGKCLFVLTVLKTESKLGYVLVDTYLKNTLKYS